MADHPKVLGPAGETLMRNIKRIREGQRLTYVELVERLASIGRPIPILGLRRIERGERRVDVDDLLALAKALKVNPVDLMVPARLADEEPYSVAAEVTTTAARARGWISGTDFIEEPDSPIEFAEAIRFMPKGRAEEMARKWFGSGRDPQSRVNEWNRQTNAWQAANEPEPRSMTDVIVDAASVAADPTAVIKQMVAGPPLTLLQADDDPEEGNK